MYCLKLSSYIRIRKTVRDKPLTGIYRSAREIMFYFQIYLLTDMTGSMSFTDMLVSSGLPLVDNERTGTDTAHYLS